MRRASGRRVRPIESKASPWPTKLAGRATQRADDEQGEEPATTVHPPTRGPLGRRVVGSSGPGPSAAGRASASATDR